MLGVRQDTPTKTGTATKTVPTQVQVGTQEQAAVAGLSPMLQFVLADITNLAREGLLAMSVATGLAVMQAMFDADITAVAGPKGKHNPDRAGRTVPS